MRAPLGLSLGGVSLYALGLAACGPAADPDVDRLVGRWQVDVAALRGETAFARLSDAQREVIERVEAASIYEFLAQGEASRTYGAERTQVTWWSPGRSESGALRLRTRDAAGVEREVLVRFVGDQAHMVNTDVPWSLPLSRVR